MKKETKLITSQIIIQEHLGYKTQINPKVLILQNIDAEEVEVVNLTMEYNSLSYINNKELNGDSFVKFSEDYEEIYVQDRTESNMVLNKLLRKALESLSTDENEVG